MTSRLRFVFTFICLLSLPLAIGCGQPGNIDSIPFSASGNGITSGSGDTSPSVLTGDPSSKDDDHDSDDDDSDDHDHEQDKNNGGYKSSRSKSHDCKN